MYFLNLGLIGYILFVQFILIGLFFNCQMFNFYFFTIFADDGAHKRFGDSVLLKKRFAITILIILE